MGDLRVAELTTGNSLVMSLAIHLISKFYENPTQEEYNEVIKYDKMLTENLGYSYEFFKLKARNRWNIKPLLTESAAWLLGAEETHLLKSIELNKDDSDMLRALFYATGERSYLQ